MQSLDIGMIHSCQVLNTTQDHRLDFVSGSAEFSVGALVTGSASGARGIVKSCTVESGSWVSGDVEGYLILYQVSGTFQAETVTDNGETPGAAISTGPAVPQTNGVGTPTTTTVSTAYDNCKFDYLKPSRIDNYESGKYIVSEPMVFLPAGAVVQEGDQITTTAIGFAGTYKVVGTATYFVFNTTDIDHIEAFLEVVKKRT